MTNISSFRSFRFHQSKKKRGGKKQNDSFDSIFVQVFKSNKEIKRNILLYVSRGYVRSKRVDTKPTGNLQ